MSRLKPHRHWASIAAMVLSFIVTMPIYAQSAADCAARADRAARSSGGVLTGAAVGAAGGAAIGAIVRRDSRKGARRGAGIGAVAGGATAAHRNNQTYKRVYDDCMAGR